MFVVSKWRPDGDFVLESFNTKVDIQPWKHAKIVSIVLVILVIITYLAFSPLGFAHS